MADTPFVYWVGDMIQIDSEACSIDGTALDPKLKGNNFNWYVTDVDPAESLLVLGAYSAFGLRFTWSPALQIDQKYAHLIRMVCRHGETVIDAAKEPSCTEHGLTEGKHCKLCGEVLVEQKTIEALGHEFEYDIETGIKVCTRCKHQEYVADKTIPLTGKDIRALIKMVEEMLAYDSSAVVPPVVKPTATPPATPKFASNITFASEWCTDSLMPYLVYTPSTATKDGTTPLIIWLHGNNEVGSSESIFRASGLPAIMKSWTLHGFNAYVVCPRLPTGDWTTHRSSFFGLVDHVVNKYQVDTRKIVLMGHALGGTGVEYLAYQKPGYFSCQVIMSGYDSGVDLESMRDFPTRVIAENDSYTSHYNELKATFGSAACTVLNCSQESVPKNALIADSNKDSVSDLLYWALSQTNNYVSQNPSQPEIQQPSFTVPTTVTVVKDNVNLRTGPSESAEIADGNNKAHAGQKLTIVEVVQSGNYNWGKLDSDIWKTSKSSSCISERDRWIALEHTSFGNTSFQYDGWVKPITYSRVTSPYGYRTHPISGERKMHNGVDLGALWGTPVYASSSGTVRAVGHNDSAGNYVCVKHDSRYETQYYHLEQYLVKTGDTVASGQLIGRCGSTGSSTGPHLHFQIKQDGQWVDPERFMKLR